MGEKVVMMIELKKRDRGIQWNSFVGDGLIPGICWLIVLLFCCVVLFVCLFDCLAV